MLNKKFFHLSFVTIFLIVICFPIKSIATSWAYDFVVWDGYVYEVTEEKVEMVDEKIGEVTKYSDMYQYEGNFSNKYPKNTKYFSIKGTSTNEAIAVETENEVYNKAIRKGPYVGEKREVNKFKIEYFIIFFFTFIVLAVIVSIVLTFKNRNHN
ncbi:hypothetical protein [Gracilibacillus suaedae]|uniref:hypothetical protein n=1 Tax=Gracilibacillus suaedae TaxID=2820273 RepID=UPI001ABE9DA2|nr:hypothetical protein [Gracilibacillus suaedae]